MEIKNTATKLKNWISGQGRTEENTFKHPEGMDLLVLKNGKKFEVEVFPHWNKDNPKEVRTSRCYGCTAEGWKTFSNYEEAAEYLIEQNRS